MSPNDNRNRSSQSLVDYSINNLPAIVPQFGKSHMSERRAEAQPNQDEKDKEMQNEDFWKNIKEPMSASPCKKLERADMSPIKNKSDHDSSDHSNKSSLLLKGQKPYMAADV